MAVATRLQRSSRHSVQRARSMTGGEIRGTIALLLVVLAIVVGRRRGKAAFSAAISSATAAGFAEASAISQSSATNVTTLNLGLPTLTADTNALEADQLVSNLMVRLGASRAQVLDLLASPIMPAQSVPIGPASGECVPAAVLDVVRSDVPHALGGGRS